MKLASVKNEAKDRAIKEHVWGANNLPDEISLAIESNGYIILPRGLAAQIKANWDDNRITLPISIDILKPNLRDYQEEAVKAILKNHQGMIHVPTGRGKTLIALGAISYFKQRTCIIVNQKHIARQWIEEAEKHIGYSPGLIGDGAWEEKDITIAMQQTLNSRFNELSKLGWFNNWGAVFLDEQHHIVADTYYKIVSNFPAKYRIGLSATKGKSDAKKKISELVFGPTIYRTEGLDIKPEVMVHDTNFEFDYKPTVKKGKRVLRNNYNKLIEKIISDEDRNNLIAAQIETYFIFHKSQLVVSRRIKHLNSIRNKCIGLGVSEGNTFMLTGKESTDERLEVYKHAESGRIVIFSTIADEALDIPRLDTLHLTFPSRNPETVKQQIGRIVRDHEEKASAIIHDYRDINVGVLYNQFQTRLRKLYQPLKFDIYVPGKGGNAI